VIGLAEEDLIRQRGLASAGVALLNRIPQVRPQSPSFQWD